MAFTAGATISGPTFPLRHINVGPFKSSGGNIYTALRPSTTSVGVYKATDPLVSFSNVGTNQSASASVHEAMDVYQVGDILHVAWETAAGVIYYRQFNTATDAWIGSAIETVYTTTNTLTAGYSGVSLVVRSDGSVVCLFVAATSSMSTFTRVWYSIRPAAGGAWGTATAIDAGGSVNWVSPLAVLGENNRVHFFYSNIAVGPYQRTLSAANALQTLQSNFGSMNHGGISGLYNTPRTYLDGATTKVRVPVWVIDTTGGGYYNSLALLDSSDAPTISVTRDIAPGAANPGNQLKSGLIYHDGKVYYLISSPYGHNDDIYGDESSDGGASFLIGEIEYWGNLTVNYMSAHYYDRNGAKMALIINDNGAIRYGEMGFIPPDTTAPSIPTGLSHTLVARV